MTRNIAIVTASSESGQTCVESLLTTYKDGDFFIKAAFRTKSKAEKLQTSSFFDAKKVEFVFDVDAENQESLDRAFHGCEVALIVTPHDHTRGMDKDAELTANMINSAQKSGVSHVVLVASWTVNAASEIPALSTRFQPSEDLLKSLHKSQGLHFSVLRGGFFNNNLIYMTSGSVKDSNQIFLPQGFAVPTVDVGDIGRSAAAILTSSDLSVHDGKFYEMNGPQILTGDDIANVLSEKLGKSISHVAVPVEQYVTGRPEYAQQLMRYLSARGNSAVPFTTDVLNLTGQHISFSEWISSRLASYN